MHGEQINIPLNQTAHNSCKFGYHLHKMLLCSGLHVSSALNRSSDVLVPDLICAALPSPPPSTSFPHSTSAQLHLDFHFPVTNGGYSSEVSRRNRQTEQFQAYKDAQLSRVAAEDSPGSVNGGLFRSLPLQPAAVRSVAHQSLMHYCPLISAILSAWQHNTCLLSMSNAVSEFTV